MKRKIKSFDTDEKGDPSAILDCGHPQHVRHNPPFVNRPWAATEKGRREKIGATLDCVRCDRFEMPDGLVRYFKTPVFTEDSIPRRLVREHTTKTGVWGKLVVVEGRIKYMVPSAGAEFELSGECPGVIPPEVPHLVEPLGAVKFFLEFYRSETPETDASGGEK